MRKIVSIFLLSLWCSSILPAQRILKNGDNEWVKEYADGSFVVLNLENAADFSTLEAYFSSDPSYNFLEKSEDNFYFIKASVLAERCKAQQANAKMAYKEALQSSLVVEDELNKSKQQLDPKEVARLQDVKSAGAKALEQAKQAYQKISDECGAFNNLLNFIPEKRNRILKKTYKITYEKPQQTITAGTLTQSSPSVVRTPNNIESEKELTNDQKKTYPLPSFVHNDLTLSPPYKVYKVQFDGVDPFTKAQRKELEKDLLFSYTDDNLKRFQKGRDFILCEANLTRYPGYTAVNLTININSVNTTSQFGTLERGSYLLLKLINGENLRLVCNHTDKGSSNPVDGTTTYNTQYVIDAFSESKLKKYEVDKLRLIWSTGFDEFDLYNMDFFINQYRSLN